MKVAVVTGSGKRRVGYHVAAALAREGYAVVVHYRSSQTEAEETARLLAVSGAPVLPVQADLTDDSAVRQMADAVDARFGRVDVLVNCAAIWRRKKLEDVTAADVRMHFDTNTLGTFLCCQAFGLRMVGQPEGGSIVNVGDWADARPYLDYAAYFPSKAAIPGLTRCLAVELAARNPRVRVNAVLPGPVLLPPDLPETERREAVAGTLVKREGTPANVVQAVLMFVQNDFVTGACLPVDGGRSVYAGGV